MRYSVTAKLERYSYRTFELLTILGFTIYIKNEVTNSVAVIDDYRKTEKVVEIDTLKDPTTSYSCLYNGDKLPSNCIIDLLEGDPNVSSYTIEKRAP